MIWCNWVYGAMDSREYVLFDFYKKNHRERKQYFTKRKYFKLIRTFDKPTFIRLIEKKNQYEEYAKFIHRDWIVIDSSTTIEQIKNFVKQVGTAIVKPVSSDCGKGVEKITFNDIEKINCLFQDRLKTTYLAEEALSNCDELNKLNPSSLNTVRVTYVIRKDGSVNIFSIMLRTGAKSNVVVDNWGAGGILLDIDIQTGIIKKPGLDELHNEYLVHPITGVNFIGFQIPLFEEILAFSHDIAKHNPNVIYGGLDIAITNENKLELIELNFPPANIGYQVFGRGALQEIQTIYR